ncbi:T9SS type A sorting domain-containing protein [Pedobacter immunditicola]|uniref:T9SS type A sorting domain-containing protein n=1 Tax=Pedobacter immunditicola TaxID=3133440 RepID=UPI0030B20B75
MKGYLFLTAMGVVLQIVVAKAQAVSPNPQAALGNTQTVSGSDQTQVPRNNLLLQLSSSVFSDSFQLVFKTGGSIDMDDQDALKVSEGYVSISSLHIIGSKLAIEERAFPVGEEEISLAVKGYASGQYHLKIKVTAFETANTGITLFDKFMNKKLSLKPENTIDYVFTIDSALMESQGDKRFSLLLSTVSLPVPVIDAGPELLAYPNPFQHHLFINVKKHHTPSAEIRIKDLSGRLVWQKAFEDVQMNAQLELECQNLYPGLYLLEWVDHTNPKKTRTLKIIKQ